MSQTTVPSHRHAPKSLRAVLLRVLIFALLFSYLVIVSGVTYFVYITERNTWRNRQADVANSASTSIRAFMTRVENHLKLAALLDRQYVQEHPDVLNNLLSQEPALLEIVLVDREGKVYASASRQDAVLANLFTIPQSSWFQSALNGKDYFGRVEISAQNEPYLVLAVPSNEGVIAGRLSMVLLWELVDQLRFGSSGQVYIVDQSGDLIAISDETILLSRPNIASRPEFLAVLKNPVPSEPIRYTNYQGDPVVGMVSPELEGRWWIFVEVSTAEAFAGVRQAFGLLTFSGIIFLFSVWYWGNWTLKRWVFEPVNILRTGAERIGQGDLEHRIVVVHKDEISIVAEAFNEMTRRLSLREKALESAVKQAMEASRFKSQLLAHVSQDLRTPLNSIMGFAEILQIDLENKIAPEQLNMLARILANSNRLLNLVNSLLDEARMERGTLTLSETDFDREKLLEPVRLGLVSLANSKNLKLEISIAPDFPQTLYGDFVRLQQILVNLVENALKFTYQGQIAIAISRVDAEHWSMSVSDTGTGIPAEAREQIFQPFFQLDGLATRHQGGLGLGLSIVKQLVHLMGGEIKLESEIGKGSTFIVILPIKKAPA